MKGQTETIQHWSVSTLDRLSKTSPDVIEQCLDLVKDQRPDLFRRLVLGAADIGDLTIDGAAELLGEDPHVVEWQIESLIDQHGEAGPGELIQVDPKGVARVVDKQVTVWEVVREHRRCGSWDAMKDAFPGLQEHDLRAALAYSRAFPEEIEAQIQEYDDLVERSRSLYPFAKG